MNLVFESERLSYRPLDASDLDLEIALWSNVEVTRFIRDEVATAEEVEAFMPIVTQRAGGGCIGIWSLTEKSSQEKIGHAVLLPLPIEAENTEFEFLESDAMPDRDIEVGYVIRPDYWGLGYATEVCRRLLDFAFSETALDRVVATTDPRNLVSQRVLRKCGMRDLGLIQAFAGEYPGFEITRDDWKAAAVRHR